MKQLSIILKEKNNPHLRRLSKELTDCGVTVSDVIPDAVIASNSHVPSSDTTSDDGLLVLTDSYETAEHVTSMDIPCIILETKENAGRSCPKAICILQGLEDVGYQFFLRMYQRSQGIPWTIVETDRLLIREMTFSDLPALRRIYDDPEVQLKLFGDALTEEEELSFTDSYIRSMYHFCGFGFWTIVEKSSGEVIGRVGFGIRDGFKEPELGYIIGQNCRRRGFAREACRAVLSYNMNELFFQKILCFVEENNLPSRSLCRSLGFVPMMENGQQARTTEKTQDLLIYEMHFE